MSALKLGESTSSLEIFPSTTTLENEIQKYVQIRDFGLYQHFQVQELLKRLAFGSKALGLGNAGKVLSLVFELLRKIVQDSLNNQRP